MLVADEAVTVTQLAARLSIIADRFAVSGPPLRGGGSDVYRAHDQVTGRAVALKVVRDPAPHGAARLAREAEVLARHDHPGLPTYVWHGVDGGGRSCLALGWIEGPTLAERLAAGPLGLDQTLVLARRLADVLAFLHERGLVHRDVKPGNVVLAGGDVANATLIDLGLVRADDEASEWTRAGEPLGTPGYMAPEQARGRLDVDARADVFGAGAVLFKCLTRRAPFVGETITATLAKLLFEPAPRASSLAVGVPGWLDDLLETMLAKDPGARPRDGRALADALARANRDADRAWAGAERSGVGPRTESGERPAITAGERRVAGVVVMSLSDGRIAPDEATRSLPAPGTPADAELAARARAVCARHGAELETLASGVLVAAQSRGGGADERAAAAVECARELEQALGPRPIALATGLGVVGEALLGEAIDRAAALLAARMAWAAEADARVTDRRAPPSPDALLVDETTAGLLSGRFGVRRAPLGAWLLPSARAAEGAFRPAPPFIGRPRELRLIAEEVRACIEGPRARAALILGAAGIGKTRLAEEIARTLPPGAKVWRGRAEVLGRDGTLALAADVLRGALSPGWEHDAERAAARLCERVGRHLPAAEAERVAAFTGELLGVPLGEPSPAATQLRAARQDPRIMADQLRRALEDLCAAECADHPVVWVLDDLHRGDPASVKLVEAMLRRLRDRPFFVLGLGRPEVRQALPQALEWRGVTTIELDELDPDESAALVRSCVGDAADGALVEEIVRGGSGNPFFLEELSRTVPSLAPPTDRGAPTQRAPETVLAMLRSSIERLPALARRVLRAASVYGVSFSIPAVLELLGGEAGPTPLELDAAFDALCDGDLVAPESRAFADGASGWSFRHDLVREAARGTLVPGDAELAHRLAGAYLAARPAPVASAVAEHFARGGDAPRAAEWWVRAAEHALARSDLDAAGSFSRRGLDAGAGGVDAGRAHLALAEAKKWSGEHGAARTEARHAMDLLPEGGEAWSRAAGELATACGKLRLADELGELTDRLLARVSAASPGALVVAACRAITQFFYLGRHAIADEALARLEASCPGPLAAEPLVEARLAGTMAVRALFDGRPDAHLALVRRARDAFERAGAMRDACLYELSVGHASIELGLYDDARAVLGDALEAARRLQVPHLIELASLNLGLAFAHGDGAALIEARRLLRAVVAGANAAADPRVLAAARIYLSLALLRAGRAREAELEARAAADDGTSSLFAPASSALAQALLALGRADEALAAARAAHQALADGGRVEEGEARIRLAYAEALAAVGDGAGSREALSAARARLAERAARIEDLRLRASFLERVPEHRRTLELARSAGPDGPASPSPSAGG